MYSEADIDAAVDAGAISADAAASFRAFAASRRDSPAADEEQFRLITGFNDIFVSIATALLLIATGWLAARVSPVIGALAVAAVSWGLAEYFTRRRRMALPSIVLLASFVGSVFFSGFILAKAVVTGATDAIPAAGGALLTVAAAAAHWRRFHVPITVAAGAAAAVAAAVALLISAVPVLADHWALPVFAGGVSLFALAMRWDMSDRARTTRRSDVAFWLHLSASPLIVHPAFALFGLLGSRDPSLSRAAMAVGLYAILALVALVVDRRALLVSALFYVLYAISALLQAAGALNVSLALTGVVVGSALLLLSAFWHPTRKAVLGRMPVGLRARMPAV